MILETDRPTMKLEDGPKQSKGVTQKCLKSAYSRRVKEKIIHLFCCLSLAYQQVRDAPRAANSDNFLFNQFETNSVHRP